MAKWLIWIRLTRATSAVRRLPLIRDKLLPCKDTLGHVLLNVSGSDAILDGAFYWSASRIFQKRRGEMARL